MLPGEVARLTSARATAGRPAAAAPRRSAARAASRAGRRAATSACTPGQAGRRGLRGSDKALLLGQPLRPGLRGTGGGGGGRGRARRRWRRAPRSRAPSGPRVRRRAAGRALRQPGRAASGELAVAREPLGHRRPAAAAGRERGIRLLGGQCRRGRRPRARRAAPPRPASGVALEHGPGPQLPRRRAVSVSSSRAARARGGRAAPRRARAAASSASHLGRAPGRRDGVLGGACGTRHSSARLPARPASSSPAGRSRAPPRRRTSSGASSSGMSTSATCASPRQHGAHLCAAPSEPGARTRPVPRQPRLHVANRPTSNSLRRRRPRSSGPRGGTARTRPAATARPDRTARPSAQRVRVRRPLVVAGADAHGRCRSRWTESLAGRSSAVSAPLPPLLLGAPGDAQPPAAGVASQDDLGAGRPSAWSDRSRAPPDRGHRSQSP